MINITKLYCGIDTPGDYLRYKYSASLDKKPVIAWNITKRCNLRCIHCYSDSFDKQYENELTTNEAKKVLDDLASFKAPVVLFSGGEPLMRDDIFEIAEYAKKLGLRCALSTNGTFIDKKTARKIKESGFSYAGISLDGMGDTNNLFRGSADAFEKTVNAFRNCVEINQKVGLRLTLTRHTFKDLHKIFDFIEKENIPRACFYHLVPSGRNSRTSDNALTFEEVRMALDIILMRTEDFIKRGVYKDILTVDNFADGIYLYLRLKNKNAEKARKTLDLLRRNGCGIYSSGIGIGCIDHKGDVHPDQFWQNYTFGNVLERSFSQIWTDTSDKLMAGLKNKLPLIKGRCARCRFLKICGAGMRARAANYYSDPWAEDPGCYLTDEEIG